jgi:hypothetical protein
MNQKIYSTKEKNNFVIALQQSSYFLVKRLNRHSIQLVRRVKRQTISIILDETTTGFWIRPPSYLFRSKISFFEYNEDETRWTRNKYLIYSIIKVLKKTQIWDAIENKDFFKVNENRPDIIRDKALKEMETILNG